MREKNLRAYVAEMVGTFVFVLISAGSICVVVREAIDPWILLTIGLSSGMAYGAAVAFTLPIAGGFLNPAVVITLWVFRRLDGVKTIALLGVQALGGILAGLVIRLVFATQEGLARFNHIGTPHVVESSLGPAPLIKAIGIEMALTFCLVIVLFGMVLDPRAKLWYGGSLYRLASLWLGLLVAAATMVAYPLTGAALNPIRWLGPAVWEVTLPATGVFRDHVPYWVGPIAGGLLAGWLYTALILPPLEEDTPAKAPAGHPTPPAATARKK